MSGSTDSWEPVGEQQWKKFKVVLWCLLAFFVLCTWDILPGRLLFYYACNKGDGVGQFVYEEVKLKRSYFKPMLSETLRTKSGSRYWISDELMLDPERLGTEFDYKWLRSEMWSDIGHIRKHRSSVVRKSDGKLLSEAVAYIYNGGWFVRTASLSGSTAVMCNELRFFPRAVDNVKIHTELLRNTFSV